MTFFSALHRSIFEPAFYGEVLTASRLRILGFLVKLFLFSVLLSGVFKTYYIIDMQRGISVPLEKIFSGMEIKDGVLYPHRDLPYIPPNNVVLPVLNRIVGFPHLLTTFPDTFLVVDKEGTEWNGERNPVILMKERSFVLWPYTSSEVESPYSWVLGEIEEFNFSAALFQAVLLRNVTGLFINSIMWSAIFNFFIITMSIIFLGIAAYLFRLDKSRRLNQFFRIACFASTPVTVGNLLVEVAGVKIAWVWHVFIFVSTIVMFRAMVATIPKNQSNKTGGPE